MFLYAPAHLQVYPAERATGAEVLARSSTPDSNTELLSGWNTAQWGTGSTPETWAHFNVSACYSAVQQPLGKSFRKQNILCSNFFFVCIKSCICCKSLAGRLSDAVLVQDYKVLINVSLILVWVKGLTQSFFSQLYTTLHYNFTPTKGYVNRNGHVTTKSNKL